MFFFISHVIKFSFSPLKNIKIGILKSLFFQLEKHIVINIMVICILWDEKKRRKSMCIKKMSGYMLEWPYIVWECRIYTMLRKRLYAILFQRIVFCFELITDKLIIKDNVWLFPLYCNSYKCSKWNDFEFIAEYEKSANQITYCCGE